jgi:3-oxoacyl-[acyl-carrier-protein] synthase I
MTEEVAIVAVGMMTSVGLTSVETAASVRAGVSRFTQIEWRDQRFERFVVSEVIEEGLPELVEDINAEGSLTWREARLLRLAHQPLLEALKPLQRPGRMPKLLLALPDKHTKIPLDENLFLNRLAVQTGHAFERAGSMVVAKGRAGGLLAIGQAAEKIRSGEATVFLAGGADCYVDLYILASLDFEGRVKSSKHLDGFIPGEGAGFVLLAGRKTAEKLRLPILGLLSHFVEGFEEGHLGSETPYKGEGLANAFQKLFETVKLAEPVKEVYSAMNGESHWAKEWGVAFLRNKAAFDPNLSMHHPADCFGELGAASGPILTGIAALGTVNTYRRSPSLVYASSDHGPRSILTLESVRN